MPTDSLGSRYVFNAAGAYAPSNFPGGTGFQFSGGRENAIGSSGMGGPTGFYQQPPGAIHSFINSIGGGGLRGISMLLGHLLGGSTPSAGGGVTPSAGGWAIDKDGNLVDSTKTDPLAGPRLITHPQGIPGWAAGAMANTRARNLL